MTHTQLLKLIKDNPKLQWFAAAKKSSYKRQLQDLRILYKTTEDKDEIEKEAKVITQYIQALT